MKLTTSITLACLIFLLFRRCLQAEQIDQETRLCDEQRV